MTSFLDRYSTSRDLEETGTWVDYGDGLKVQVRRLNSKVSREYRRKIEKPYASQFRAREMPEALQEELLNKQIANVIVVAWEGVPDPKNPAKPLECNPDSVLTMIQDFPDFRDDILTAAMERTTFQKEQAKAGEKN